MQNKPDLTGIIELDGLDGGLTVREIVFHNVIPEDLQPVKVSLRRFDIEKQTFFGTAACVSIAQAGRSPDEIRRFSAESDSLEVTDIPVEVTIDWLSKLLGRFCLEVCDRSTLDRPFTRR